MKRLLNLENLRINEEILKKQGERVWTGFNWLKGPAEKLSVSKEGNFLKGVCLRSYAVAA